MMQPNQLSHQNETINVEQKEIIDKNIEEEKKKQEVKDACNPMMEVLMNSDNPRWRNCKMLAFLKKLDNGAYKIVDDKLIKDAEKLQEFKESDQKRKLEEEKQMEREKEMEEQRKQDLVKKFMNSDNQDEDAY